MEFEWVGADQLRTRQRACAVQAHPRTGELVWFNQAHLFHVSRLSAEVRDWLLAAYGKGFASAKWVLAWMLVTAVIDSINTIFVQTLMASGQAWLRLLSNGLWAVLALGSSLLLVPAYGALGLAMALCAAQSIHLCLQTCLSLYATRQTTIPSKPEEIVAV